MADNPAVARATDTLSPPPERVPAIPLFVAFASAYFFSALIRAITATLAPTLVQEFALTASDLGLLSGGYFFGFSMTQLPLGAWLDRFGPKRVLMAFLVVAVTGCLCFAAADSFWTLCAARVACGVGLSACLMAPLTAYRRWYRPDNQQRASSWMLMTGSLGFVASTLPVQWLMPVLGWRGIFLVLAALLVAEVAIGIVVTFSHPRGDGARGPRLDVKPLVAGLLLAATSLGLARWTGQAVRGLPDDEEAMLRQLEAP